ncbi:MAG: helix-turn-helix domain-containing protein [Oscillospiraceae bacterium]|nr:helix-turn-helix domain-containing protein [Oscillospiraceae bacterium]
MKTVLDVNLYDIKEVAELLGVSKSTVHNYLKFDRLEAQKIGGKLYCTEESIKAFLNGNSKISNAKS